MNPGFTFGTNRFRPAFPRATAFRPHFSLNPALTLLVNGCLPILLRRGPGLVDKDGKMIGMIDFAHMTQAMRMRMRRHILHFAKAEDGVMLALVMSILLIMLMVGGLGVEVMRTEMERTRIQQVIDTASLAAAHEDNSIEPKDVVMDYFAKANLASYITRNDITVERDGGSIAVEVNLNAEVKTPFLKSVGNEAFTVPARGRAERAMGDSEVSLVLDISGSMKNNNRMTRLHSAAKEFIDTVLPAEAVDHVSVNLVPYTGDVNAGWDIFSRMNVRQLHSYSYCVKFTATDFDTTTIDPSAFYLQAPYFKHYDYWPVPPCPTNEYEEITAVSQNADALKTQIGKLDGSEQTSIHLGMKWGVGLLDPAFRPVINSMVDASIVDEAFRDRPADLNGPAMKVVVLMTDGENTETKTIKEFAYDTPDMRYYWATHGINQFESDVDYNLQDEFFEVAYSPGYADTLLQNICTAAKNQGIMIYTIGFEINDDAASEMEDCASSASHFYRVEGVSISDAFKSIARELKQLRLTL